MGCNLKQEAVRVCKPQPRLAWGAWNRLYPNGDPEHPQIVTNCSLHHAQPILKIQWKSIHMLFFPVMLLTDTISLRTRDILSISVKLPSGEYHRTSCEVNISSGDGLLPDGTKLLPKPMLTQIYVAIWHHKATNFPTPCYTVNWMLHSTLLPNRHSCNFSRWEKTPSSPFQWVSAVKDIYSKRPLVLRI